MLSTKERGAADAPPDLRHALRVRTREAHERLDAKIGGFDTVDGYGDFLTGLYAFRAPVERELAAAVWPSEVDEWRPRLGARAIASDLANLGRALPEIDSFTLSKDVETLVGVSYVLEGSALGARLLVRQASILGFDAQRGAAHLSEQAGDIENWRGFVALLHRLDGLDFDCVVAGANEAFGLALAAMDRSARG